MFTNAECAQMADAVYYEDAAAPGRAVGPTDASSAQALSKAGITLTHVFEDNKAMYRAAIWQRSGWRAFVVRGTVPDLSRPTNLVQDLYMKLLDAVPYALVKHSVSDIERAIHPGNTPWIAIGHSLGGCVAQVLGLLYGVPFVTFNAPGMYYDVVRRGWAKHSVDKLATGPLLTPILSAIPGISSIYRGAARATPFLDQSYDETRASIAREVGGGVSNEGSTAAHDLERQLGTNIAHRRDLIHQLLDKPIGGPWQYANFVPAPTQVPTQVRVAVFNMPSPMPGGNIIAGLLAGGLTQAALDVLRYHDSRALADYIAAHNWGTEAPVQASFDGQGHVRYSAPSYMSTPGWGGQLVHVGP